MSDDYPIAHPFGIPGHGRNLCCPNKGGGSNNETDHYRIPDAIGTFEPMTGGSWVGTRYTPDARDEKPVVPKSHSRKSGVRLKPPNIYTWGGHEKCLFRWMGTHYIEVKCRKKKV